MLENECDISREVRMRQTDATLRGLDTVSGTHI